MWIAPGLLHIQSGIFRQPHLTPWASDARRLKTSWKVNLVACARAGSAFTAICTGQFPKVEVNVVPDPLGLRLNFLLEPAYYLGMVNFPGAIRVFSYTRLLQVADLHEEDPYDTTRVAASEKALQDFLRRNGRRPLS